MMSGVDDENELVVFMMDQSFTMLFPKKQFYVMNEPSSLWYYEHPLFCPNFEFPNQSP